MAGALYFAVWLGSAEPTEAFDINQSFLVLFMIIIGGLGSVLGFLSGCSFFSHDANHMLKNIMVDGFGTNSRASCPYRNHDHRYTLIIGFSDCRATRASAPVADRQGKIAPLAVSLLI